MATLNRFILLMLVVSTSSFAKPDPTLVDFPLDRSFVPIGFDDNDRAQVTVAGVFPDTCYRVAAVSAKLDEKQKKIFITQTAYHYTGICTRVFVPFASVVDLGIVGNGDYQLVDAASGKALGRLPVTRASHPGADDHMYALINDANVHNDGPSKKWLTLSGELPDRCSEFKEVQVHYYPETIVVQPIVKRIGELCAPYKTRFVKEVQLDSSLRGVQLLHVRSLSGQALNKLVDVDEIVE